MTHVVGQLKCQMLTYTSVSKILIAWPKFLNLTIHFCLFNDFFYKFVFVLAVFFCSMTLKSIKQIFQLNYHNHNIIILLFITYYGASLV